MAIVHISHDATLVADDIGIEIRIEGISELWFQSRITLCDI